MQTQIYIKKFATLAMACGINAQSNLLVVLWLSMTNILFHLTFEEKFTEEKQTTQ